MDCFLSEKKRNRIRGELKMLSSQETKPEEIKNKNGVYYMPVENKYGSSPYYESIQYPCTLTRYGGVDPFKFGFGISIQVNAR